MNQEEEKILAEVKEMLRTVQEGARDLILFLQQKNVPIHHAFAMLTCASVVLGGEVEEAKMGCEIASRAAAGMKCVRVGKLGALQN